MSVPRPAGVHSRPAVPWVAPGGEKWRADAKQKLEVRPVAANLNTLRGMNFISQFT